MSKSAGLVDISDCPPPWRSWPETNAVISALQDEGGVVRFVGGCVRDALLGIASEDIDIATDLLPGAVMQGLERAGVEALPTGLDHGTITAVCGKRHFEITTLRVDLVGHGRHADIAFTHDWEVDAERRDFTFNALYLDPTGELIDPVGGLADLKARHVRFIGNADDRIREDRLRVLRYFRFFARFGDDNPDAAALKACAKAAGDLGALSVERVQKEILLLLATKTPLAALELMKETGVLEAITGVPVYLSRISTLLSLPVESDALLRFAALLHCDKDEVSHLSAKLRFSNKQKERLTRMCEKNISREMDERDQAKALYWLGKQTFVDQAILLWAELTPECDFRQYLDRAERWQRSSFPVTGRDLLTHGVAEGAALGKLLNDMEMRWVESSFRLTKEELLREFLPDA